MSYYGSDNPSCTCDAPTGSENRRCDFCKQQREEPKKKKGFKKGHKPNHTLPPGEAVINSYFYDYKRAAKDRKISFELTLQDFKKIIKKPCVYCGDKPTLINKKSKKLNGDAYGNGVDRVNNHEGYTVKNCKPCCKLCNYMKWKSTTEDFLAKVDKIYNRHSKLKVKKMYCCGIGFQFDLDLDPNGSKLYPSIEACKKANKCWKECGIVEVEVRLLQWIEEQDMNWSQK